MLTRLDHVQLLMPPGGQERGRNFFGSVLGMTEEAIPPAFAGLGGLWFRSGSAVLHLAVLENAVGQKKAHPAFCVRDLAEAATRLRAAGWSIKFVAPTAARLKQALSGIRRILAPAFPRLAADPRKL